MPLFEQQDLFISGEAGYARYRIPALVTTHRGTLLAFCEGRRFTGSDADEIDLLLRRSEDGGRTWKPVQTVAHEAGHTIGNPAPVVDATTGTVWLLLCRNLQDQGETLICEGKAPRTVWVTRSDDDGRTWAPLREITADVKRDNWTWYATGPGHGIQLQSGRLLVACDHIVGEQHVRWNDPHHSHVIYSDDHGKTWRIGGIADDGTNESTAVETLDGWVQLNCRNNAHKPAADNRYHRAVTWSRDGGESFCPLVHDAALPEPICQASLCRFTDERTGDRNRVLFSNPGVTGARARRRMTVRLSYDECRTWPVERVIHEGLSAYSDLCVTSEMAGGCLYECGMADPYERLRFARFDLDWLTNGQEKQERLTN